MQRLIRAPAHARIPAIRGREVIDASMTSTWKPSRPEATGCIGTEAPHCGAFLLSAGGSWRVDRVRFAYPGHGLRRDARPLAP